MALFPILKTVRTFYILYLALTFQCDAFSLSVSLSLTHTHTHTHTQTHTLTLAFYLKGDVLSDGRQIYLVVFIFQ